MNPDGYYAGGRSLHETFKPMLNLREVCVQVQRPDVDGVAISMSNDLVVQVIRLGLGVQKHTVNLVCVVAVIFPLTYVGIWKR